MACTSKRAPIPARERWPRHPHANFYFLQEDSLAALHAAQGGWSFTIWRPQVVFGESFEQSDEPYPRYRRVRGDLASAR